MIEATEASLPSRDVLVIGSGSAGLSAALRAAAGGLSVKVFEKTSLIGGTSAMSGAGTWIPANHHAREAGLKDSLEEAVMYLRAASPPDWREEEALWRAFVHAAPRMLQFVENETPLRFALTEEPDVAPDLPGGKDRGRMLSPKPLSKRLVGEFASRIRHSTLPHLFTYQEFYDGDLYHRPLSGALRLGPRLVWRWLTGARGQGSALIAGLLKGCLEKGCEIETNARVVELLTDPADGRVSGLLCETAGQRTEYKAARGVIVASGGFEWNAELLGKHFPGGAAFLGSPSSNEGDGQRLAASVGAKLDRMDQANIYPSLPTRYEGRLQALPFPFQAEKHAIVVDRSGKRFVSEYSFNIGEALDRRDPLTRAPIHLPAWMIGDRRFLRRSPPFYWYARKCPNWLIKAGSIRDLAAKLGLPQEELVRTVDRFNRFCAAGRDDDFHRGESAWEKFKAGGPENSLGSIEEAPFLAAPFSRSILGTKGGVRTNADGQALRPDGSVIAGLYAAGLAMANPIGTRAVGPGTTIGPNLAWGFICAESLLKGNFAAS
jgi:3-oxosteroid 1-dehydrogenase